MDVHVEKTGQIVSKERGGFSTKKLYYAEDFGLIGRVESSSQQIVDVGQTDTHSGNCLHFQNGGQDTVLGQTVLEFVLKLQ